MVSMWRSTQSTRELQAPQGGAWREVVHGHVIGHKKIDLLAAPVDATAVRLRILAADGPVEIRDFGIYIDTASSSRETATAIPAQGPAQ